MKKRLFIYLAAAVTFICLMSCENPVMKSWWEEQEIAENGVDGSNNGKVDPVVRWPSDLKAIYGQKLSDIALPCNCTTEEAHGTFTWTNPNISLSKARKQTYNMTFTPDDISNYNIVTKDAEITVIVINMVKIPAGTFMMGSPVSEPRHMSNEDLHQVTLSGFYMCEYTVTEELYDLVMGYNPEVLSEAVDGESETPEQLPVTHVNWYDTLVFCNKLSVMMGLTPAYCIPAFNNSTDPADWGKIPTVKNDLNSALWNTVEIVPGSNGYRLPTEAQWEYACRAGTTTAYNTGDTISNDTGWYLTTGSSMYKHKVGLLPANTWGLYDMHGNVFEWCWDWYDENYYSNSPANNPMGPSSGTYRIMRGGSHRTFNEGVIRSAFRAYDNEYLRWSDKGFRLVRP
jgi:formylglycine-generating enzyme required for sulfatase activity